MLSRIQYLLFVLLFVLLGTVPSIPVRNAGDHTCATLCKQQAPSIPAPSTSCFATLCNGVELAGTPHGVNVRVPALFVADQHAVSSETSSDASDRVCRGVPLPLRAADYYVFSLEHILI